MLMVCVANAISDVRMTSDSISLCAEQAERLFLGKGFSEIHRLTLVLTDLPEQWAQQDACAAWLVDAVQDRLIIRTPGPENFYGLREQLEQGLQDGIDYEGSWMQRREDEKFFPYVTAVIAVLNFVIYCVSAFTGDVLYNIGDFNVQLVLRDHEIYRLVTSMFLHINLTHLSGNMILLIVAGRMIEKYCGHGIYLAVYLLSGIMGNAVSGIWDLATGDYTYSVGASGAIMGLIGALLAIVIYHKGHYREITLPRVIFMIAYILYFGFTSTNVNNLAHIGGALSGFICLMILNLIRGRRGTTHED